MAVTWKFREKGKEQPLESPLHPVVAALLSQRLSLTGQNAEEFLFPNYERDLHDPFLFSVMERVVSRIGAARDKGEKVGIFGDFDADGVTSSVIIRETLLALGMEPVIYLPHKMDEGHGFNVQSINFFEKEGV
ncbi:MAG: single-stranded-DNA-specific exonuclease RecJ, partial [Candidatus Moraniibacteriota bacterium]